MQPPALVEIEIAVAEDREALARAVFRPPATITLGYGSRAVLRVEPGDGLPQMHTLVELRTHGSELHVTGDMGVEMRQGGEVLARAELVSAGRARPAGEGLSVTLDMGAKGTVRIGGLRVLLKLQSPAPRAVHRVEEGDGPLACGGCSTPLPWGVLGGGALTPCSACGELTEFVPDRGVATHSLGEGSDGDGAPEDEQGTVADEVPTALHVPAHLVEPGAAASARGPADGDGDGGNEGDRGDEGDEADGGDVADGGDEADGGDRGDEDDATIADRPAHAAASPSDSASPADLPSRDAIGERKAGDGLNTREAIASMREDAARGGQSAEGDAFDTPPPPDRIGPVPLIAEVEFGGVSVFGDAALPEPTLAGAIAPIPAGRPAGVVAGGREISHADADAPTVAGPGPAAAGAGPSAAAAENAPRTPPDPFPESVPSMPPLPPVSAPAVVPVAVPRDGRVPRTVAPAASPEVASPAVPAAPAAPPAPGPTGAAGPRAGAGVRPEGKRKRRRKKSSTTGRRRAPPARSSGRLLIAVGVISGSAGIVLLILAFLRLA